MRNKQGWRKGLALGQIMATLLVVLPTMAFIVTFIIDYWSLMQADYKLKLIANMSSVYYISKEDITDTSDVTTALLTQASGLCPNTTTLTQASAVDNASAGTVEVIVRYVYNGTYLTNKTLSTNMITYSYNDQNRTVVLTCQ